MLLKPSCREAESHYMLLLQILAITLMKKKPHAEDMMKNHNVIPVDNVSALNLADESSILYWVNEGY